MMKRILAGGSLVAWVLLSNPAYAQSSTPTKPPSPAPAQTEKPTAPVQPATSVSPDELKKFASAVRQMLTIADAADTQITNTIKGSPIGEKRFGEIFLAKRDPNPQSSPRIAANEEQSYNQTLSEVTRIQKEAQEKMDKAVLTEFQSLDRFNQVFAAVQRNPKLQQEVKKMIQP